MRRITEDERALFLAALAGRLPTRRVKPKTAAAKTAPAKTQLVKKTVDHPGEAPRGRHATPEEAELFFFAISGGVPPKPQARKTKTIEPPPVPAKTKPKPGLDGNTLRRLTRGEIAPTAKIDLHGLTEAAAHGALCAFVLAAHRRGDRLVLIVTGKGSAASEPERVRGILKQMVPRWLEEAPMAKIIAEMRWAHRRHGGEGALYVYLRKQRQK